MELEIKEKQENKLLNRLEVKGTLTFEGATPSNEQIRDSLASTLNKDKELIIMKHIYSKFSYQEAEFLAFVYDNQEARDKTEIITKHLKKKAEEETKKKAEEAEATAEAAPKEEEKVEEPVKEEPKVEEKPEAPEETPAAPTEETKENKE
ncbi:hypothetical protein HOC13_03900 [Candidatus Woesearchaeota archaeon]|jgi:ribosomal protein S24E|nr:hypothetical protein [Candidatus Woesearchaeota archaeon]